MKFILVIFFSCIFSFDFFSQQFEPFVGKLTYSINIADTSLSAYFPEKKMVIYTNDSLLRIENYTEEFGVQVLIKHLVLNKSYLLLALDKGKFAIQTNHQNETQDSSRYQIEKKRGKTKICGINAKKIIIHHADLAKEEAFYYFKNISPKYLNAFPEFPGLPVVYYLNSEFGLLKYQLIEIDEAVPNYDLFGIPSDFKKISFDDFVQEMIQTE
jgi:hypothetical protein